MNQKKRSRLENNLYNSLIAYRLNEEVNIIQDELNNLKEEPKEEKKTFKKIVEKVVAPIKHKKESDLYDELIKAKTTLNNHIGSVDEGIDVSSYKDERELKEMIDTLFYKDNGSLLLSFSLDLALSTTVDIDKEYLRDEESLKRLSLLIFDDENLMMNLRKTYLYTYKKISEEKDFDETTIGSFALAGLIAPFMTMRAIILGMASTMYLWNALKGKRKYQPDESLMCYSSLVAGGNVTNKFRLRRIRRQLKQMNNEFGKEAYIHSMVSGLVIYNFTFKDKSSREAKEALSNYIQLVDDLRGDAEYLAFVEKVDVEDNYAKIEYANKCIKLLKDVLKEKATEVKEEREYKAA